MDLRTRVKGMCRRNRMKYGRKNREKLNEIRKTHACSYLIAAWWSTEMLAVNDSYKIAYKKSWLIFCVYLKI